MKKLFIQILDNGFTLTITTEERQEDINGDRVVETKRRLVYERQDALEATIHEELQ